jgi:hypothetical protein
MERLSAEDVLPSIDGSTNYSFSNKTRDKEIMPLEPAENHEKEKNKS